MRALSCHGAWGCPCSDSPGTSTGRRTYPQRLGVLVPAGLAELSALICLNLSGNVHLHSRGFTALWPPREVGRAPANLPSSQVSPHGKLRTVVGTEKLSSSFYMALQFIVSSGVGLTPEQKHQELFPLPFWAEKAASLQNLPQNSICDRTDLQESLQQPGKEPSARRPE